LLTFDSNGQQTKTSDNKCVRNPIQSESKSESESYSDICSEQPAPEPKEPPVITLQLNTGAEYGVSQEDVIGWSQLYPAVDIMQALRNMKGWLLANPAKRKTEKGIKRFITSWLQKEQDKGGTRGYTGQQMGGSRMEQFAGMARGWADQ
jgi:hypothetical protein